MNQSTQLHNIDTIKIKKSPRSSAHNNDVTDITLIDADGNEVEITAFGKKDTEVLIE